MEYLQNIYELTYLKDVIERNRLRNVEGLKQLVQILASSIGFTRKSYPNKQHV